MIRHHIITGVLSAAVSIVGALEIQRHGAQPVKVVEHQIEHQVSGKYGWGDMTADERAAAAKAIGNLDRQEIEIFCGTSACDDLAQDLDETFDLAQAASTVRRPFFDLVGMKGIGIAPANDRTKKIAKAISDATQGRIALQVFDQKVEGGSIHVVLASKPR